ncbi:MAG: LysR family transcriptional regulator [Endozoicomonas sp.]|uniref:LysR family transcriptional regulator n=1 Tax=Endozoicomonas sp. TaxID=1892382 RepID=UPI003D9B14E4
MKKLLTYYLVGFAAVIKKLRAFLLTQETGSISAAARRMNKPRVLISNWIASLEDEWGVSLLDRTGYTPTLTDAGKSLMPTCQSLLTTSDLLERKAQSMQCCEEQAFALGIDQALEKDFLTPMPEEVTRQFPTLNLTLQTGFDDELLEKIENQTLDMVLTSSGQVAIEQFSCKTVRSL